MKIIAFGPCQDERPMYPDALVLLGDDLRLFRDPAFEKPVDLVLEAKDFDYLVFEKQIQSIKPVEFREGYWPVFEFDNIEWFKPDQIEDLRSKRAYEFLKKGQDLIRTDPIKSAAYLRMAGKLSKTNVAELYSDIDKLRRHPKEDIGDVYARSKK